LAASDRGDDVPFGLRNHHGGSLDEDDEAALRCDEFLCISAPPETTPAPARAPHRMVVAAYKSGAANLAYLPPIPSLEDVPSMAHAVAPSPARPCEAQREAPIAIYSAPEPRMLDRDHLMKSASECAHEPVDLDFVNTPTKAAGGLCSRYARLVAAEGVAFAARLGKPHRRQKTDRADPNRIGGRRWRHVRQELQRALDDEILLYYDEIEAGHIAAESAPVGKAVAVYPELHLPTAGRESLVDTHLEDTAKRGRAQLDSAEDCVQACGLRSCNKPSVAPATRLYLRETLSMVKPEAESNLKPQPKRQRAYSAVTAPPTGNSAPEAKPTAKPDGGQAPAAGVRWQLDQQSCVALAGDSNPRQINRQSCRGGPGPFEDAIVTASITIDEWCWLSQASRGTVTPWQSGTVIDPMDHDADPGPTSKSCASCAHSGESCPSVVVSDSDSESEIGACALPLPVAVWLESSSSS
jgi:hypothetical protein